MSNTEKKIIQIAHTDPTLTARQISMRVECSRSHVAHTLARYRRGGFEAFLSMPESPPLSRVELCIRVPSDINHDLCKITRLAA